MSLGHLVLDDVLERRVVGASRHVPCTADSIPWTHIVDDVLIHFQFCFALVQLLLRYTGLDRVEVTHLVLCEVPLQLLVNGNSLEFDVVVPLGTRSR